MIRGRRHVRMYRAPLGHQLTHTDHEALHGAAWQDPTVHEVQDLGSDLEVAVVVQDRHSVLSCQDGGQQVGDSYRSMPPGPSQDALRV